jgi:hypothetical protein
MSEKLAEVWDEVASHLQVALTAIETALSIGPAGVLPHAQAGIMGAWRVFESAASAPAADPLHSEWDYE